MKHIAIETKSKLSSIASRYCHILRMNILKHLPAADVVVSL